MEQLPELLLSGELARLIPVVADTSKENRATSVLLATIASVDDFAKLLLGGVGQRLGSRAKCRCYTEVVFRKTLANNKIRPDGLLVLTVGNREWSSLIETKIGKAALELDQITNYCQLAKLNGVDAVITLSNQFAALPTHHPLNLGKSATRGVALYHWSWMHVLTQASLLLLAHEFKSAEQKYLLSESVRYFKHGSVGVTGFTRMNPGWKEVVLKVQSGAPLDKKSDDVQDTVAAWHQEQRDLCLLMSRKLGRQVSLKLTKAHGDDQMLRLKNDVQLLVDKHSLTCILNVPDAAAPITVSADLGRRTITSGMSMAAPKDKKGARARINWLIRQLSEAKSDNVFIKADWPGRALHTQAALEDVREDFSALTADKGALVPQNFEVLMVRDLAGRFSGSKTFIEHLEEVVPAYYENVGQHLREWVAPPPKMLDDKPDLVLDGQYERSPKSSPPAATVAQPTPSSFWGRNFGL